MTDETAVVTDREEPIDLSDARQVKERNRELKRAEQDRMRTIRWLMSTKDGRKWVWDLLEKAHVNSSSFATNALITAHNEGERNIGLWVMADVTTFAPDHYVLMLSENSNAVPK